MNLTRKLLLTTTASLAILFGGCSVRNSAVGATPPETNPTVATVMQDYNTKASQSLASMSADFNKDRPAGTQPVIYVDYDQVVTWAELQSPQNGEKAISDFLKTRTSTTFDAATLEKIFNAMSWEQPTAFTRSDGIKGACVVVPEYPGATPGDFYRAAFQVGDSNLLQGKVVTLGLTQQELSFFATAHETWHCFDIRYRGDTGDGLVGAVKDNHAEMFADIGGAMESIKRGADLSIIDKIASERAAAAFLSGPARAQTQVGDLEHFYSIVYNTQPGLYALKSKIQDMGIDNFRKLDRTQMRDLDYSIVDAQGLKLTQAAGLWSYYSTGKAPAAVQSEVAQLRDIAAKTVRIATKAEIAALQEAPAPASIVPQMTQALQKRAGELGDANSLASQLKARQEMTDALRADLSNDPASVQTQAKVNLLFLSNPRLNKD